MSNKLLETALAWHSLKIVTIPILQGSKKPALESWKEWQTKLPRETQLKAWFSNPGYNLAVVCGHKNLVVVDIDDNTCKAAARLDKQSTYCVATLKGWHYYYFAEEPSRCLPIEGGDVRGYGGYVLAPPSVHPSGYHYLAYGNVADILRITSLHDILPEYTTAVKQRHAEIQPKPYDPFEDAVRPWVEGGGVSVEEIKKRWSVADMLGVTDGRAGRTWRTNCPIHGGTHSSLAVYSDGGWRCFACGQGGDVIDLYVALHKVDIKEALRRMSNEMQ